MSKLINLSLDSALNTWNELALNNTDELTISHQPELFHFFTEYLNLSSFYFILYHHHIPVGLLPLVRTGKRFISLPHFSYGGIHWKTGTQDIASDEEVINEVLSALQSEKLSSGFYRFDLEETKELQQSKTDVEIRGQQPMFKSSSPSKVVHLLPLKLNDEALFDSFPSNLKRKINKSLKNELSVRTGKAELLKDFSGVYNRNMHHIGSPTLGKSFFQNLMSTPGLQSQVFVAYLEGQPIGGSFVMWYDGYYENTWFSTLHDYNRLYTSYLLHWEMIRHAISLKAKVYSMGRSTFGSGVYAYKSQWPVLEKPIYFNRTNPPGSSLKDQKWATSIWKVLPGFFVDAIGPGIAKRIY